MYMLRFGSPPFLAAKVMQLCFKIIHDEVVWPRKIDEAVQRLLDGMLQKDPAKRLSLPQILKQAKTRFKKHKAPSWNSPFLLSPRFYNVHLTLLFFRPFLTLQKIKKDLFLSISPFRLYIIYNITHTYNRTNFISLSLSHLPQAMPLAKQSAAAAAALVSLHSAPASAASVIAGPPRSAPKTPSGPHKPGAAAAAAPPPSSVVDENNYEEKYERVSVGCSFYSSCTHSCTSYHQIFNLPLCTFFYVLK